MNWCYDDVFCMQTVYEYLIDKSDVYGPFVQVEHANTVTWFEIERLIPRIVHVKFVTLHKTIDVETLGLALCSSCVH